MKLAAVTLSRVLPMVMLAGCGHTTTLLSVVVSTPSAATTLVTTELVVRTTNTANGSKKIRVVMVCMCKFVTGLSPDIDHVMCFRHSRSPYDKLKLTTIMASTAASTSPAATAASAADTVYYTVNTKDVEAPKTPFLHEIWNYEGDLTILPRKFSSCVQAAFGDHGEHSIAPSTCVRGVHHSFYTFYHRSTFH